MKPALLVLAAGMGSRYGGLKQIEPLGPGGETIIDYSVYDALRAGFGKLVFVIRRDIERPFREIVGSRFEARLPVEYVFQELETLPRGMKPPAARQKPWGTGHAVLMGAQVVREPFAVINGDDFYGRRSFEVLARHLQSDSPDLALVGYTLKNTLSEFGTVARGVCRTSADGYLESIRETTGIEGKAGTIQYRQADGQTGELTGEEVVSLNTWGFRPAVFELFAEEFERFLAQHGTDTKAEFYIPSAVNSLIQEGKARLKVLQTPDSWFGVTYREDRPRVVQSIRELVARGEYPEKLWCGA